MSATRAVPAANLAARLGERLHRTRVRVALRGCDSVGDDILLAGAPYIDNLGRIEIGHGVRLRSRPVVSHLVTGRRGTLTIGDGATICHGAAIAAHLNVTIGERAYIGPFAMIMDTDFHEAGDHGAASQPRAITIGAGARLGPRVTVLRGARIGENATVTAGSVVAGNVAPGAAVAGVPARDESGALDRATAGGSEPVADRARRVVARTFGLGALPAPSSGPHDLAGWDSLGALNLLLSLEHSFAVTIDERDMLAVRSVADVEQLIESKLRTGRAG